MPEIETARLRLRGFTQDDLDDLLLIRSDPEVMRYIGTGAPATREQTQARINNHLAQWEQHGFGQWAVVHKGHGKLIGWCGLGFLERTPEVEIGYGFDKPYWGMGIASEAAAATLRYGFERLQLESIVAVAMPENIGSWRVMEKLGMKYVKRAHYYETDVLYYAISREEYRPGESPYILRS
ncbi:MAG TPA: GNAT family N-acetyltransferase [Pyrinomonadaceae bacterium]|nr:GNAT family N-acetyltransferase [Pyrinomonadaceae bacterium]